MTESQSRIGVALSGGGNRAALFAIGALMYFVDSGKNRSTSAISSVSGGTLANGFVAQCGAFDQQTSESFRNELKPLIRCMARSSPLWGWWGTWLYLLVVIAAVAGVIGVGVYAPLEPWLRWLVGVVGLAIIERVLVRNRTVIVSWAFRAKLYHGTGGATLLAQLPKSSVDHVFCATDLHAGEHVYFSRNFVYSYRHGGGSPGCLPLDTAVQASSCFPGALPARWIRTSQFHFPPRTEGIPLPQMALVDGGVYDNMGEQYLTDIDNRKKRDDGFPKEIVQPNEIIIVNSSGNEEVSSQWRLKLPFVGELFGLLRVINTLFDNTTTTRRSFLFERFVDHRPDGCFVSIERSPQYTAATISKTTKDPDVAQRASDVLKLLSGQPKEYWDDLAKANTHASTTFRGLGDNRTTDLLWHGYLSAMCNSHVVLGYPLPGKVPSRTDFLTYVQNS